MNGFKLCAVAAICILLAGFLPANLANAQSRPSNCKAFANALPQVTFASFSRASLKPYHVRLTFTGHSTWVIETGKGVTIATDFAGWSGEFSPDVVTMNNAHDTHYTEFPDPDIKHVLRGWNPEGGKAEHHVQIEDVLVRNVTTDTIDGNVRTNDENSIFIFEVEGLCIGHLGHLHHQLSESQYADIGRLDVVMVPIDGAMTLSLGGMATIVKRLRASVILPMHARGFATPADFITMLEDNVDHKYLDGRSIELSLNNLPERPTVFVPRGL